MEFASNQALKTHQRGKILQNLQVGLLFAFRIRDKVRYELKGFHIMSELDSIDTKELAHKLKNLFIENNITVFENLLKIAFDQGHSQAWSTDFATAGEINPTHPKDSSYAQAFNLFRDKGFSVSNLSNEITDTLLDDIDVLILPHSASRDYEKVILMGSPIYLESEIEAIVSFVNSGGGLLVLSEHEINKYGNNINQLLERFDVSLEHSSVQDNLSNHNGVAFWPKTSLNGANKGILARVSQVAVYRAGTIKYHSNQEIILTTLPSSDPANMPLMIRREFGLGSIIVVSDSDLFGDDSINDFQHRELFYNLVTYLGAQVEKKELSLPYIPQSWNILCAAIEKLKSIQESNGSVLESSSKLEATVLIRTIQEEVITLIPDFHHDELYLLEVNKDLSKWEESDFGKPDFYNSLALFHPESMRIDGLRHLVIFPMYTQNGNTSTNFEALIVKTFWPQWLALIEANGYDNKGFLTLMLEIATSGYSNHCATLFPETVSTSKEVKYTWGAIFADRESARFRKVASKAFEVTKLEIPGDMSMLLNNALLAQEVFALWDLVHDRTHMRGDLPFDPFMIKQRSPFWMYGLEELRCDLNSYKEASELFEKGFAHGRLVMYSVLFDRIFRFAVTGERIRNYDSLAGQIIFSYLHSRKVLNWRDNVLTINWLTLDENINNLRLEIEALYRDGINSSKVLYWSNAYKLVANIVQPSVASNWQSPEFNFKRSNKEILDDILEDEFPLSLFHEALLKKIHPTLVQCSGITGRD